MAHGDFVRDVSSEDAELVLTLMSEVLDDVYQSPARVKRAQDARAKRQQAPMASGTNLALLLDTLAKQQKPTIASTGAVSSTVNIQVESGAKDQADQN